MVTHIAFQGPSHFRVLAAADLALAGVEGFKKTEFPRRVPVEVEDRVAQAILERPKLYGNFKQQEPAPVEVTAEIERRVGLEDSVEADTGSADAEDTGSSARKTAKKSA